MHPDILLKRLNEIGGSLARSGRALALIGCGSVGLELERLDEFSDLDFLAIVEPGSKQAFLDDLSWLSDLCPIAYCFTHTHDGYKLLYTDGIFCEFGVIEIDELPAIPFSPGRIVWKKEGIPDSICQPTTTSGSISKRSQEWLLGEALTNLLVGLAREKRGEKLSATRFIQGYALDRVVELAENIETAQAAPRDIFVNERRFEQRHPRLAQELSACLQGYDRNRQSALAILNLLEQHFTVNPAMANAIRELSRD